MILGVKLPKRSILDTEQSILPLKHMYLYTVLPTAAVLTHKMESSIHTTNKPFQMHFRYDIANTFHTIHTILV